MAKTREEIVGKRFLSVSSGSKLKLSKINEWDWRGGVVRACTHNDSKHQDLQVLVEYDDVEWQRREWVHVYRGQVFQIFLLERTLAWASRKHPTKLRAPPVLWPALVYVALVDRAGISEHKYRPVEYLVDRALDYHDYSQIKPYQDGEVAGLVGEECLRALRAWVGEQDGQRILLTTPSVLVGFRVQVYRAEGTTQWYTAVIVGYNDATRELTVTDDTVLEEHSEDPSLVQIRLIGEGVVESILRGENVGITPRRSRTATNNHHQSGVRHIRRDGVVSARGRKTALSRPSHLHPNSSHTLPPAPQAPPALLPTSPEDSEATSDSPPEDQHRRRQYHHQHQQQHQHQQTQHNHQQQRLKEPPLQKHQQTTKVQLNQAKEQTKEKQARQGKEHSREGKEGKELTRDHHTKEQQHKEHRNRDQQGKEHSHRDQQSKERNSKEPQCTEHQSKEHQVKEYQVSEEESKDHQSRENLHKNQVKEHQDKEEQNTNHKVKENHSNKTVQPSKSLHKESVSSSHQGKEHKEHQNNTNKEHSAKDQGKDHHHHRLKNHHCKQAKEHPEDQVAAGKKLPRDQQQEQGQEQQKEQVDDEQGLEDGRKRANRESWLRQVRQQLQPIRDSLPKVQQGTNNTKELEEQHGQTPTKNQAVAEQQDPLRKQPLKKSPQQQETKDKQQEHKDKQQESQQAITAEKAAAGSPPIQVVNHVKEQLPAGHNRRVPALSQEQQQQQHQQEESKKDEDSVSKAEEEESSKELTQGTEEPDDSTSGRDAPSTKLKVQLSRQLKVQLSRQIKDQLPQRIKDQLPQQIKEQISRQAREHREHLRQARHNQALPRHSPDTRPPQQATIRGIGRPRKGESGSHYRNRLQQRRQQAARRRPPPGKKQAREQEASADPRSSMLPASRLPAAEKKNSLSL